MFKHDAARTGSAVPLPSGAVTERPVAVTPATAPRTTTSRPRSSTRSAPSPTTTAAPTTTTEAPATTTSEAPTTTTPDDPPRALPATSKGGNGPSPWLYAGGALIMAAGAAGVFARWRLLRRTPGDLSQL